MKTKILKIGIASRQDMKARTLAIARGELKPHTDDPKVWFSSLESLAQVMSTKNQLLLEIIRRAKPASLKELAQLSERRESNLSRTLHTMERYGLVELQKSGTGTLVPSVPYERYQIEYSLTG